MRKSLNKFLECSLRLLLNNSKSNFLELLDISDKIAINKTCLNEIMTKVY